MVSDDDIRWWYLSRVASRYTHHPTRVSPSPGCVLFDDEELFLLRGRIVAYEQRRSMKTRLLLRRQWYNLSTSSAVTHCLLALYLSKALANHHHTMFVWASFKNTCLVELQSTQGPGLRIIFVDWMDPLTFTLFNYVWNCGWLLFQGNWLTRSPILKKNDPISWLSNIAIPSRTRTHSVATSTSCST